MRSVSLYHRCLRVAGVILAGVLLFDSGLLIPVTRELSDQTGKHVASVIGVGAAVEPTELNTLTAELTKQKQALDKREAALSEREIAVGLSSDVSPANQSGFSTYILSALLFVIVLLLILNYVMDFLREQHLRALAQPQSVR